MRLQCIVASDGSGLGGKTVAVGKSKQRQLKVRAGPDGIHFFNRTTGVNLLLDEATVPVALWSAAPRQVSIALTNACDLRCPHCYAPKHLAELNSERLMAWLDELDANGFIGVGFGGGEPTLYRELPRVRHHAAENTGLAVTLLPPCASDCIYRIGRANGMGASGNRRQPCRETRLLCFLGELHAIPLIRKLSVGGLRLTELSHRRREGRASAS
jgi:hypothetical protein